MPCYAIICWRLRRHVAAAPFATRADSYAAIAVLPATLPPDAAAVITLVVDVYIYAPLASLPHAMPPALPFDATYADCYAALPQIQSPYASYAAAVCCIGFSPSLTLYADVAADVAATFADALLSATPCAAAYFAIFDRCHADGDAMMLLPLAAITPLEPLRAAMTLLCAVFAACRFSRRRLRFFEVSRLRFTPRLTICIGIMARQRPVEAVRYGNASEDEEQNEADAYAAASYDFTAVTWLALFFSFIRCRHAADAATDAMMLPRRHAASMPL